MSPKKKFGFSLTKFPKKYLKQFNTKICSISSTKNKLLVALFMLAALVLISEYLLYYIFLSVCSWPQLSNQNEKPLRAMIMSDTHILGPLRGHWLDKMRREWQMHRAFQAAMTLFSPEVVFVLGDLFDEGDFVDNGYFTEYAARFKKLFKTPKSTKMICAVGNHDVGFHYRMYPTFVDRFETKFKNTGVELHTIRNIHFVTINSMAMLGDGCNFCDDAERQLKRISGTLRCAKNDQFCTGESEKGKINYSRPILLQHFPTFRSSDKDCIERDSEKEEKYRPNWEVLSKEATRLLGDKLNPRLAFSGHSHHYCKIKNTLGIPEYTVASFSWRNKPRPSFMLAEFTTKDHAIHICYMPTEANIVATYVGGLIIIVLVFIMSGVLSRKRKLTINGYNTVSRISATFNCFL